MAAALALGACVTTPEGPPRTLPEPGFAIDRTRSDPGRPARAFRTPYDGPLYDVQVHLRRPGRGRDRDAYLDRVLEVMTGQGVQRAILMATPNSGRREDHEKSARYKQCLADRSGGRIGVACGGNYSFWLHRAWREGYQAAALAAILEGLRRGIDSGRCRGLGEIGLYHFNKSGRQPVIEYAPDFPPFVKFAALAAETGVWLTLHAEPVEPDGVSHERDLFGGLALLFRLYPKLKLILAHAGMTNPANARHLLATYPGMMMDLKPAKNENWTNLESIHDSGFRLYEDWARLFEEMPARFVIGIDAKFGRNIRRYPISRYVREVGHVRNFLGSLDPDTARMIAYENALRMFGGGKAITGRGG